MKIYEELEIRGLVAQVTGPELRDVMNHGKITAYCGFDPTSDSLHIGNLLPIITLRRLQLAGHQVIALAGGATGLIGDPSGKSQERNLLDQERLAHNLKGISKVLGRFLDFEDSNPTLSNPARLVNNATWFQGMSVLDFLRDVGKHFTVNYMIAKDSVRIRMEDRENGLSYTEFSYMILQGYDFYHLHMNHGCNLQIGGSDQWGNITAGTELIRRKQSPIPAFGLTFPLITKADGTKFGKTESGAVWLSPDRTSPYQFYQFFLRTADADVVKLLRFFTFLPLEAIADLEASLQTEPEKRLAQIALAKELTTFVHGEAEYLRAKAASEALFSQDISKLDAQMLLEVFGDAPSTDVPKAEIQSGISLIDLLVKTGLASSKGEARKDIQGGGVNINNVRVTDVATVVNAGHLIHGGESSYVVLRKGKKNFHLVAFK